MDLELKNALETSNKLIEALRVEQKADSEKVARMEAELAKALEAKTALEARVAEVETKAARPGAFGNQEPRDEYKDAFMSFMRKTDDTSRKSALEAKAADIRLSGDSGAGFALPKTVETAILTQLVNENPLRGLARVITVGSTDHTEILDRANAGTAWVGETDVRGTTTAPDLVAIKPKFGELTATVEVSAQSLEDLAFDVEAWLVSSLVDRFGTKESEAFVNGDGVNKPLGLLHGSYFETVKSGSATGLGDMPHDRIVDLLYGVGGGYRTSGAYVMNSATLAGLVKVKDTTGAYLYTPAITANVSDTILGKRVATVEAMPNIEEGETPIAFGDLARAYVIADRIGVKLIVDPYTKPGFVRFTARKRVGGTPRDDKAMKFLRIAA